MELPVTDKRMSKDDFIGNEDELNLAECAVDNFLRRYLVPEVAALWIAQPRATKLNLFRWGNYLVARCWITGEIPLSATLTLKKAFKPWEIQTIKMSQ